MDDRPVSSPPSRTARGLASSVLAAVVVAVLGLAAAAGCHATAEGSTRPNVVFILTDDLSWNLVRYMPHVQAMERDGVTFDHFYVTDSLCCPSRASILTGRYPHNTGVHTNTGPQGGFRTFHRLGDERRTFAVLAQRAGYDTGLMGKYLNEYLPADTYGTRSPYVPPGWTSWDAAGDGYPEFDYSLNENGRTRFYGMAAHDYLTDVLARRGTAFIRHAAATDRPFELELSTFAPHWPTVPAPRDARRFPHLRAPRPPSFGVLERPRPLRWERLPRLTASDRHVMDVFYRRRVQAVQAVDAMIGRIERVLRARGLARDTYLVFSSDNGYHLGEHRLHPGKKTAFDTDIRVPLVVTGPHVQRGRTAPQIAQTVDLYPTFADIVGADAAARRSDGQSLLPILDGSRVRGWRRAALVEHYGKQPAGFDPDRQPRLSGVPPSYEAIRTLHALYVEYADGTREYYDTARDPYEMRDRYRDLRPERRRHLHAVVSALRRCRGPASCAAPGRS